MSDLKKSDVVKIMNLCCIELTNEEQDDLLHDLSKILDYMKLLEELDTKDVNPCDHVIPNVCNVMRDDSVGETISRDKFLDNSPEYLSGMVKVPQIINTN